MTPDPYKIVFAGTPEFAVPSLQALLSDDRFEVLAVFTQPDRPSGRGQVLTPPPVKVIAEQAGLPVFQPEKLDSMEIARLKKLDPSFLVVVAYGLILPREVLELPKYGCLNVHTSLLPKYRGASPIQQAILSGDSQTGVSFMQLSERLDAGPVYAREPLKLNNTETAAELSDQLAQIGARQLPEILVKISAGELKSKPQDKTKATTCGKVKKSDGQIDWAQDSAVLIERKLRAYTPWPGIFTEFQSQLLKITDLEINPERLPAKKLGEVYTADGQIFIATRDGAIRLKRVQLAGRKELAIEDFVRGETEFVGSFLK